ncbi:beta-galactosidase [Paraburkholderia bryophila]|uniref:beta-galactosidase n=1 Tax=Burkholderiaceae TaxID=119060 RepID=UPI0018CCDE63|nr:beta-galactosidase [Burkholderia sp. 9120]
MKDRCLFCLAACGAILLSACGGSDNPDSGTTSGNGVNAGNSVTTPPAGGGTTLPALPPGVTPQLVTHKIGWDHYTLKIDGKSTPIWSGEFHPFRLPSPSLWLDVLQKLKANGFNAVSIYFDWGYSSAKSGTYDFTGIRDMDMLLDMAAQAGLYVIARPGPYINAETDAGGLPGWLLTQSGKARSSAPDYIAAARDWMGRINQIIARHQLTNGGGTVILYQVENEMQDTSQMDYMNDLSSWARSDGITVPMFHNNPSPNGNFVPANSSVAGTVAGPVQLYAFDDYPQTTCSGNPGAAWYGMFSASGGATGGTSASPYTPGFIAEMEGGWFDSWGSSGIYPCMAQTGAGSNFERLFYGSNIANRIAIQNIYMAFGGTSWGWLPSTGLYTSYDYGAAIDEGRQLRPKAATVKALGYFVQSVPAVMHMDVGGAVTSSAQSIQILHGVDNTSGANLYTVLHSPSNATSNDTFTFPVNTPDGSFIVPQQGTLRLNGADSKMLLANYSFGQHHLVYSTSDFDTQLSTPTGDVALLYGRQAEEGETVLRFSSAPTVQVLGNPASRVSQTWDPATGLLRLNYQHNGLIRISIAGGGSATPLMLLVADDNTAATFWRQETAAGPVLAQGPALLRTAVLNGTTLAMTGDTQASSLLEVWSSPAIRQLTWNGAAIASQATSSGSLLAGNALAGPDPVSFPALSSQSWRYAQESPEALATFDDSTWTNATLTTTNSTTPPPSGQPVLTADDYGFHHGDVWYRGRLNSSLAVSAIALNFCGGQAGLAQVWIDGNYLGQSVLGSASCGTLTMPVSLQPGTHVISAMVRNNAHNEDWYENDAQKEGRGLISVSLLDASSNAVATSIAWKIQGNRGGENLWDVARGPMNNGGLWGERNGWYLPGFPDSSWPTVNLPATGAYAGTSWFRTTFPLSLPAADDVSVGIQIGGVDGTISGGNYRALIFVNGWNMGQYIANVGPQHTFVVPNGVLNPSGQNTIAIAVTSNGNPGDVLESVRLVNLGTVRGGVPVQLNVSPDYSAWVAGNP